MCGALNNSAKTAVHINTIDWKFVSVKNFFCKIFPMSVHIHSLVPRLPRSGTQTLKLYRRGEPGIFSHVRSAKR